MRRKQIERTKKLAKEFIRMCDEVLEEDSGCEYRSESWHTIGGTKKSGELRRLSMTLTRNLAEMRKP